MTALSIWFLLLLACAGVIVTPRPADDLTPRMWMRALVAATIWIVVIVWGLSEVHQLAQLVRSH